MKNLITILLATLFLISASYAQESNGAVNLEPTKKMEQVQEMKDAFDNLSPEVNAQVQKATQEMDQIQKQLAECKTDAEKESVMEQLRTQTQTQTQNCLDNSGLSEETQTRVRKAMEDIEKSQTQKQAQFKDCKK